MVVGAAAEQNDHTAGRIGVQFIGVELVAQADVEHARNHRVDSILRMAVWHQLLARGEFDSNHVWTSC